MRRHASPGQGVKINERATGARGMASAVPMFHGHATKSQQGEQRSSLSAGALLVQVDFSATGNGQIERGADKMHDRQTCGVVGRDGEAVFGSKQPSGTRACAAARPPDQQPKQA